MEKPPPKNNKPDDFWIFLLIGVLVYWGIAIERKLDTIITQTAPKETVTHEAK